MPIDLRSDTVTKPTPEMRRAMAQAEVGDDVYGEDPTANRLEEMAANLMGKEAALFLPSGTMANQVAVMTHCARGDEIILETESHIFYYEVGGVAVLAGAHSRQIRGEMGIFSSLQVEQAIREENIHHPPTSLICVENTHNRAGGTIWPLEELEKVYRTANSHRAAVHMDGARIFNAAAVTRTPAAAIARHTDSVMFCLSKGLGAPVGSLLCGSREFIDRARKNRKMLGGGMRQVGVLAAAGIVALEKMVDRLEEDHCHARLLAEGLAEMKGVDLDLATVQTNIVMFQLTRPTAQQVVGELARHGVLVNSMGPDIIRLVTHYGVGRPDIDRALGIIGRVLDN